MMSDPIFGDAAGRKDVLKPRRIEAVIVVAAVGATVAGSLADFVLLFRQVAAAPHPSWGIGQFGGSRRRGGRRPFLFPRGFGGLTSHVSAEKLLTLDKHT